MQWRVSLPPMFPEIISNREDNMKKKNLIMAAAILTVALLAGCGKEGTVTTEVSSSKTTVSSTSKKETSVSSTSKEEKASTESSVSKETDTSSADIENKEEIIVYRQKVFDLFSGMTIGWNLGNTLDSHGAGNSLRSETYWGNPKVTPELFAAVKEQGFNTVRIPVTWAEHLGAAPDYKINEEWLNRVKEIVDYAVDLDLYIILDTHHETDFWLKTKPENAEALKSELAALWTQIAETFKDYNEKLIFEGLNEPRLKGSAREWNGGTPDERKLVNDLNRTFIDAVRATGGNNEERCLIICTYGHCAEDQALKDLEIPADPNIAVAVHMYTPYFFTYEAQGSYSNWNGTHKSDISNIVKLLKKYFLDKGIPVIITETGAVYKENSEEIVKWINDYFGIMDEAGIKCAVWDNGIFRGQGERFGVINRSTYNWNDESIANAYTNRK